MSDQPILIHVENKVATLTFNRPDKLNALNRELVTQSIACLKQWSRDAQIGAIVVTGNGRAFCAGGDVGNMAKDGPAPSLEEQIDGLREAQELSWLLYNLPKPTIAAVNGYAMGAGLGICLACDLRVASESAKFGTAYAKVGLGGDFGTTWLLARAVGSAKAKEMFFLSDAIDATEACRLGLVNRVTPTDQLAAQAGEMAARIAHGPLTSYRYMKANVNQAMSSDMRSLLDREAETHLRCGQTQDHQEGARAFMEKRPPNFIGQ